MRRPSASRLLLRAWTANSERRATGSAAPTTPARSHPRPPRSTEVILRRRDPGGQLVPADLESCERLDEEVPKLSGVVPRCRVDPSLGSVCRDVCDEPMIEWNTKN